MRARRRSGFTLVEILVVLAVGLLLAAAFVPAMIGWLDRTRIDESAASLAGIAVAAASMWRDTGRYPGSLSHLTTPIAVGQTDICGATFGAAAANWAGPYLNRFVPTTGLPLPIGVARDVLTRIDPPPAWLLVVSIDDVSHEDAVALNRKVDADDSATAGAVRWGTITDGAVVLDYMIPIRCP